MCVTKNPCFRTLRELLASMCGPLRLEILHVKMDFVEET